MRYAVYERVLEVAVEIVSSESAVFIEHKRNLYLEHGAKLVLIVYPEERKLRACRPDGNDLVYSLGDTFTAPDLLPDFSLPLGTLFSGL